MSTEQAADRLVRALIFSATGVPTPEDLEQLAQADDCELPTEMKGAA